MGITKDALENGAETSPPHFILFAFHQRLALSGLGIDLMRLKNAHFVLAKG